MRFDRIANFIGRRGCAIVDEYGKVVKPMMKAPTLLAPRAKGSGPIPFHMVAFEVDL